MNNTDKITIRNLKGVGFYNIEHTEGLKSARIQDAIEDLPNTFERTLNPPIVSTPNQNMEDSHEDTSDDLQGDGVKIIIPSNIVHIYTRLQLLLGLKLSGHTKALSETSNLIDESYKRGEIQN